MEKKILYHIGLYGFRKLIVYVIKDNGDRGTSWLPLCRTSARALSIAKYAELLFGEVAK